MLQIVKECPLCVLKRHRESFSPLLFRQKMRFHAELAYMRHENMPCSGKGGSLRPQIPDSQCAERRFKRVKKACLRTMLQGSRQIEDISLSLIHI